MSRVNWRGVARDLSILTALSGLAFAVTWAGDAMWNATAIVDTRPKGQDAKQGLGLPSGDGAALQQSPTPSPETDNG